MKRKTLQERFDEYDGASYDELFGNDEDIKTWLYAPAYGIENMEMCDLFRDVRLADNTNSFDNRRKLQVKDLNTKEVYLEVEGRFEITNEDKTGFDLSLKTGVDGYDVYRVLMDENMVCITWQIEEIEGFPYDVQIHAYWDSSEKTLCKEKSE